MPCSPVNIHWNHAWFESISLSIIGQEDPAKEAGIAATAEDQVAVPHRNIYHSAVTVSAIRGWQRSQKQGNGEQQLWQEKKEEKAQE